MYLRGELEVPWVPCARNRAEGRRPETAAGIVQWRCVRQVEYLGSKFEIYFFSDSERFPQHQVRVLQGRSAHRGARTCPNGKLRRCRERRPVEPLRDRAICEIVGIANPVRALRSVSQIRVRIRRLRDYNKISRLCPNQAGNLP